MGNLVIGEDSIIVGGGAEQEFAQRHKRERGVRLCIERALEERKAVRKGNKVEISKSLLQIDWREIMSICGPDGSAQIGFFRSRDNVLDKLGGRTLTWRRFRYLMMRESEYVSSIDAVVFSDRIVHYDSVYRKRKKRGDYKEREVYETPFEIDEKVYLVNGLYEQHGKVVKLEKDKGGWWITVEWMNSRGVLVESCKRAKSVYREEKASGEEAKTT